MPIHTKIAARGTPVRPSGLAFADRAPPGVELISGPGRSGYERGNLLFRCADPGGDVLLKIYRQRKSGWRDLWSNVSERWVERKRGASADRRRVTEAAALAAWTAAGFDVPRLVDRDRPAWIGVHPFVAMEFVAGPTLHEALADPARPAAARRDWVDRLAREHAHRHRRALDCREPLLVHEHAMARHVLVSGERLVTFDFEHAYQARFPVAVAVAYEVASTLRSLERIAPEYFNAFVDGYAEPKILAASVRLFRSPSLRWRIYRHYESRRRGAESKTAVMERLAARLSV
jgi:tRNA A-37 threonylcarbamoyl transferase component Bud32